MGLNGPQRGQRGRATTVSGCVGLVGVLCLPWLPAPAAAQHRTIIRDVRVVDGRGLVAERATVVLAGGRIRDIAHGPVDTAGATVIAAEGLTLLPGLIDAHTHLLYQYYVRNDSSLRRYVAEALPQRLRRYVEGGVTSVLSTGDHWPEILEVRRALDDGRLVGPRLFLVGPVFSAVGGHPGSSVCAGNAWCRAHLAAEVADEHDARRQVRAVGRQRPNAIKIVYDRSFARLNTLTPAVLGVLITEAHALGLPAVVHVGLADEARTALALGADALVHVPKDDPAVFRSSGLAAALAAGPTVAVTTLGVKAPYTDPAGRELEPFGGFYSPPIAAELRNLRANVAFLAERGVPLVLGTDTPMLDPLESVYREIDQLEAAGLTPLQIIQTFTSHAARHPALSPELGSIAPGMLADGMLVEGDPLASPDALRNVVLVLKGGAVMVDRRPTSGVEREHR